MIKRFALAIIFTSLVIFLGACDNSEVETLTTERDALQVQVEELNTRIADTETERDALVGERDTLVGERDTLQRDFDTLTADFERTTSELEEARSTLQTTRAQLERAERELVARGVERDAILNGLQSDLERQVVSLRGEIEQTMATLGDIEQERDRLRNRLGEDVFPNMNPEPTLGTGSVEAESIEETTVTVDTTEAVDELLEQAEEIEEELEEEVEDATQTP